VGGRKRGNEKGRGEREMDLEMRNGRRFKGGLQIGKCVCVGEERLTIGVRITRGSKKKNHMVFS